MRAERERADDSRATILKGLAPQRNVSKNMKLTFHHDSFHNFHLNIERLETARIWFATLDRSTFNFSFKSDVILPMMNEYCLDCNSKRACSYLAPLNNIMGISLWMLILL